MRKTHAVIMRVFKWLHANMLALGRPLVTTASTVAGMIAQCALMRPESCGLNYNLDFPDLNPDWAQRDSVVRLTFKYDSNYFHLIAIALVCPPYWTAL